MNVFDEYTHRVLHLLLKHRVQFIVVGGYAVNYHGFRRTTGDIDLWIKPENGESKKLLINAFKELGIDAHTLERVNSLDFTEPQVFTDGEEPFQIDFLTKLAGVNFDEAWDLKNDILIDGIVVPFLHFNHLILSKISSNRPKDKIDIEELQKIQKLRKKK